MKLAKPVGTKTKLDEVFLNVAHDSLRGGRGWRLRGNGKRGTGGITRERVTRERGFLDVVDVVPPARG